jgi:outer membrane lipoprotein-sorting protein
MRWLLLLLLLLPTACARPPAPLWTDMPAATELVEILHARAGTNSRLDSTASVSITTQGKNFSTQQFILAEQPDRVRVDALTGFGQLVMQLTSDGDVLSVLVNTTNPPRFYRGSATEENFSRFVRLPLSPELLVAMLLYEPPILDYQQAQVRQRGGMLELLLVSGAYTQTFYFDGQLQLTGSDYAHHQQTQLAVDYSRFASSDGFPRRIALQMPQDDVMLAMNITELTLNGDIPAERFYLQAPENIAIEPIP